MMARIAAEGSTTSLADEGIKSSSMSGFLAPSEATQRSQASVIGSTEGVSIG